MKTERIVEPPLAAEREKDEKKESSSSEEDASSSEEEDESSSGEEETTSEEEAPVRLTFKSKANRTTIRTEAEIEEEKRAKLELKKEEEVKRKKANRRDVKRVVAADEKRRLDEGRAKHAAAYNADIANMPDDTDGIDEKGEFTAWKEREFARLKRERDVRTSFKA